MHFHASLVPTRTRMLTILFLERPHTRTLRIGASAVSTPHKYAYIPFTRPLGDTLKDIVFKPYQLPAGMTFVFQVISSTYKGVYVKVVRTDSVAPWTHRLRVVYNVRGLRFIEPQSGSIAVGPSVRFLVTFFAIRFVFIACIHGRVQLQ
jgi:hypothetical protein